MMPLPIAWPEAQKTSLLRSAQAQQLSLHLQKVAFSESRPILLLPILLVFGMVFLASASKFRPTPLALLDLTELTRQYSSASEQLTLIAESHAQGKVGIDELQNRVALTRLAYKRLEPLLLYFYPAYTEAELNGAPLLKADKFSVYAQVVPPQGLQVLDELAYEELDAESRHQLALIARSHQNAVAILAPELRAREVSLAEWIEACRLGLINLYTTGLTGFDTPGSLGALTEAKQVLQTMLEQLEAQTDLQEHAAFAKTKQTLLTGLDLLQKQQDFEQFDRLEFLRKLIDPALGAFSELRLEAELEVLIHHPTARRLQSDQLFSPNFLDPYFFTELTESKDSPQLRELGKRLFYDPSISESGKLSCASCHQPEHAFTDGLAKSASNTQGQSLARNAPTLLNAVYADRYFYDLRAFTLEQQAEHVIFNPAEYNTGYEAILSRLSEEPSYRTDFEDLFGKEVINREKFASALGSYVASLQSFDSAFDRYARGETEVLAEEIKRGFNLFMGKAACGTCHFAPSFSGLVPPYFDHSESEILGVLATPHTLKKSLDEDRGRAANGLRHEDLWIYEHSFKTPTVRNVALTAPYFHNGAYRSLDLVMDFYDHGGGAGLGLVVPNQTLSPDHLQLSKQEKSDLIAFMEALTEFPEEEE